VCDWRGEGRLGGGRGRQGPLSHQVCGLDVLKMVGVGRGDYDRVRHYLRCGTYLQFFFHNFCRDFPSLEEHCNLPSHVLGHGHVIAFSMKDCGRCGLKLNSSLKIKRVVIRVLITVQLISFLEFLDNIEGGEGSSRLVILVLGSYQVQQAGQPTCLAFKFPFSSSPVFLLFPRQHLFEHLILQSEILADIALAVGAAAEGIPVKVSLVVPGEAPSGTSAAPPELRY